MENFRHGALWAFGLWAAALVCFLPSGPAAAFQAEDGHRLARTWCSSCHEVEGADGSDVAPSFRQIATDPATTPKRLRAWLSTPHPAMPDFNLSRPEIDSIIAYLETLRGD